MPDLEDTDQVATGTESAVATKEQPSETKQMDLFSISMPNYEVPEVKTPTISIGITQMLGLYDTNGACYHFHQAPGESDQQFLMRVSQTFHEALIKELGNARKMEAVEKGMPKITLGKSIDEILA
jgi:hypothetical protein